MALKTKLHSDDPEYVALMRKSDQEWELGGLARQDGDKKAMEEHYEKAREYQRQANEILRMEVE
jgi:hypothetical protein